MFDTREAKKEIDERDWRERVAARAQEHGLGAGELDALAALPPAPPERPVSAERLAERLFSAGGLTATRNTFHDRDVVIGVADSFQQGAAVERVLELARQIAGEREVVAIPDEREPRYTTRELLAAEETIVAQAQEGRGQHAGVLEAEHVERSLEGLERKLSDEQERAVSAIATAGHRIDTVEALAGTGKTTSAAALRELYERAGYRVIGAAPTGRAVRELKERAGIGESRTLDSWALKLAADPTALSFATLTDTGVRRQPAVMIIDEAGMAHTRLSARVIHDALAAEVKVIAIGDSGQLSSVQAGGWLGALSRKLGSHELREVMRQRDPRERRLLAHVHRGEPDAYLELKTTSGELRVFAGEQPGIDAESALIDRWAAQAQKLGVQEAVMITRENQRRERLNQHARERMRELGELGESVEIGGREWAVGDRVIARRNDRGRDLDNGMRGTVIAVDAGGREGDHARRRRRHPRGRRRVRRAAPRARVRADRAWHAERHRRLGGGDRPAAGLLAQLVLHRAVPRPRADRHLSRRRTDSRPARTRADRSSPRAARGARPGVADGTADARTRRRGPRARAARTRPRRGPRPDRRAERGRARGRRRARRVARRPGGPRATRRRAGRTTRASAPARSTRSSQASRHG